LSLLPLRKHPKLLIGLEQPDDAGAFLLDEKTALVQTVDFFTPIVDEPFAFGRIAAANALSDIYAMGAQPLTALNILAYPSTKMSVEDVAEIIKGGLDALKEADCFLLGGHSVDDNELKYGLAITGIAHPDRLWTVGGAKVGDSIILTKPIGTGVVATAIKGGVADKESAEESVKTMSELNRQAAQVAQNFEIHACTDITGFGLVGHLLNIAQTSGVSIRLNISDVPLIKGAYEQCASGLAPAGLYRNKEFYSCRVKVEDGLDEVSVDMMFDPQTSGGLALFVEHSFAGRLLSDLKKCGIRASSIGVAIERTDYSLILSK